MFVLKNILFSLIIFKISADNVVSDVDADDRNARKDKNVYNKIERRFLANLEDSEWHISHLKDTDFPVDTDCVEETFQDKVKKYRKALQNDGGRVQFVSADALPFDVNDLKPKNACTRDDQKGSAVNNTTPKFDKSDVTNQVEVPDDFSKTKVTSADGADSLNKENVATTPNVGKKRQKIVKEKKKKEQPSRRGDYLFSTEEYYEEGGEWDSNWCPDVVTSVELEIEHIRPYDLECQRVLMWRSLDL